MIFLCNWDCVVTASQEEALIVLDLQSASSDISPVDGMESISVLSTLPAERMAKLVVFAF